MGWNSDLVDCGSFTSGSECDKKGFRTDLAEVTPNQFSFCVT